MAATHGGYATPLAATASSNALRGNVGMLLGRTHTSAAATSGSASCVNMRRGSCSPIRGSASVQGGLGLQPATRGRSPSPGRRLGTAGHLLPASSLAVAGGRQTTSVLVTQGSNSVAPSQRPTQTVAATTPAGSAVPRTWAAAQRSVVIPSHSQAMTRSTITTQGMHKYRTVCLKLKPTSTLAPAAAQVHPLCKVDSASLEGLATLCEAGAAAPLRELLEEEAPTRSPSSSAPGQRTPRGSPDSQSEGLDLPPSLLQPGSQGLGCLQVGALVGLCVPDSWEQTGPNNRDPENWQQDFMSSWFAASLELDETHTKVESGAIWADPADLELTQPCPPEAELRVPSRREVRSEAQSPVRRREHRPPQVAAADLISLRA